MARLAGVVVPGPPHHVTQRGDGRAKAFFGDEDCALHRDRLGLHCREDGVAALAPALGRFPRFAGLIDDDAPHMPPRQAETIGRPPGAPAFLAAPEAQTNRRLRPQPRGP